MQRRTSLSPAWNLDAVGQSFATAALDSTRWTEAMEVTAAETGSIGAVLMPVTGGFVPNNIVNRDIAEFSQMFISSGWYKRDIRVRGIPRLRQHGVFSEQHYTTPEEIAKHPYFQELLRPMGLRWSAIVRMRAGGDLWAVALQRTIQQGPFSQEELAKLDKLSDDVSATGAITNALGFARAEAALEAFELSGTPVILLNRNGLVLRINQAAESVIGQDLQIVQQRVIPRDRDAAASLDRSLHHLLWNIGERTMAPPPTVIPRAGRTPILAYPVRLAAVSVDALAPCQAAIILHDPEQRPMPSLEALKICYGLTDAEAKLAARLAAGDDLTSAADVLGVARVTVRNQLAATMRKMGVNRQAELVAAVTRVAPKAK